MGSRFFQRIRQIEVELNRCFRGLGSREDSNDVETILRKIQSTTVVGDPVIPDLDGMAEVTFGVRKSTPIQLLTPDWK